MVGGLTEDRGRPSKLASMLVQAGPSCPPQWLPQRMSWVLRQMDECSQARRLLGQPLFSQTHSHGDSAGAPRAWLPLWPAERERPSAPQPHQLLALTRHPFSDTQSGCLSASRRRCISDRTRAPWRPLFSAPQIPEPADMASQPLGWLQCGSVTPHLHPTRRHILLTVSSFCFYIQSTPSLGR